jgi:hypothetical protein
MIGLFPPFTDIHLASVLTSHEVTQREFQYIQKERKMALNVEDNEGRQQTSKLPQRKYGYFRDDQIVLLLEEPESLQPAPRAGGIITFTKAINTVLGGLYGMEEQNPLPGKSPYRKQSETEPAKLPLVDSPRIQRQTNPPQVFGPPEVISFPALTEEQKKVGVELVEGGYLKQDEFDKINKAFTIAVYHLGNTPSDPATLMTIIQELPGALELYFAENNEERSATAGLVLRETLPNWLMSAASQGAGTGGPGGRPYPYYGSRQNAPYRFSLQKQLKEKNLHGDGGGVDVVILDTAPSVQDLVRAYKELPDHPLVPTLLGPAGKLHLYPATYEDQLRMSCTSINDHDYKMTDHGLFIAGIIHSIVPKAEIHLIEVLNQYGVGDFWSFVKGFMTILQKIYDPGRKMVVNCSWMLDFPYDNLQARDRNDDEDPDARFAKVIQTFSGADKSLILALEFLLNRLYVLGRQAVAAAGNDGRKEDGEGVKARYPAALTRVAGVGSLPRSPQKSETDKFIPSVFSNLSDAPARNGIATFGGEEGEGKGVLGIYIGEFPGCCRNESKWAWWAGTSFATPIVTAAIAAVLSHKPIIEPDNPDASTKVIRWTPVAIDRLYNATNTTDNTGSTGNAGRTETSDTKIIQNNKVRVQEDALLVIQG